VGFAEREDCHSERFHAHAPVAIAFLATPPPGLDHVGHAEAAGCSYGAFTHGVELSPEQGQELQSLIGTMIELKYLKSEEIPAIPHRTSPMRVAAYAPLAKATFDPDVIVFRGNVRQIMLLSEAARAAGVIEAGAVMGRPACAMIPQAIDAGASVVSVGCIGNRVYTGLGDDELYLTVPGSKAKDVLQQLETILTANRELETFHRQRAATIA